MVASYFAQGAFKETMQALFVLAFVLALREAARNPAWRELPLRFVPAALIAVGSVYAYSYPGPALARGRRRDLDGDRAGPRSHRDPRPGALARGRPRSARSSSSSSRPRSGG